MSQEPLLLIGAGGHTKSCIEVIEAENRYKIVGLIGSDSEKGKDILGYKVIGSDNDLNELRTITKNILITIGQIKTFEPRKRIFLSMKELGFHLVSVVSPFARVARTVEIGAGTVVFHNVVLNSDVKIGENCIINTGAILEHDVTIGNHSHVSTGCLLNGGVSVGDCSFIGSGTVVKENLTIGSQVIVGMSSKVLKNISDAVVFV
ncbi:acetyltransferase [Leptospira mtsangambouensis]|uniref:Acetyltransferase n=1 Tax=Leptospira mtsangambouensis TaxID=2484912 RepID=A0ABY2P4V6_9LEPT|nr:acetyltransferase [Leptospira mtsangambouensis]TGM82294.1 acetyltransferase [Leptospira mtsangambouensis]